MNKRIGVGVVCSFVGLSLLVELLFTVLRLLISDAGLLSILGFLAGSVLSCGVCLILVGFGLVPDGLRSPRGLSGVAFGCLWRGFGAHGVIGDGRIGHTWRHRLWCLFRCVDWYQLHRSFECSLANCISGIQRRFFRCGGGKCSGRTVLRRICLRQLVDGCC